MNKLKLAGALACCCLAVWGAAAGAATNEAIAQREVKTYFPGDFVHIIVEAPPDTAVLDSLMPNDDRIELVHDRRANVWHGLWQVPIGFPSGTYTAVLEAKDMQGETFSGETAPFIIGELTMIMIAKQGVVPLRPTVQQTVLPAPPVSQSMVQPEPVKVAPAPVKAVEQPVVEPAPVKVAPAPVKTVEQPVAAPVEKEVTPAPVPRRALVPPDQRGPLNAAPVPAKKVKWSQVKWPQSKWPLVKPPVESPVASPVEPPARISAVPAPSPKKVRTRPVVRSRPAVRSKRPAVSTRKMKFVQVFAQRELSPSESRLVTTTRYYMEKMEFDKVQASLTALIKLAPSDQHYRQMLRRVDKVIKTEKNK